MKRKPKTKRISRECLHCNKSFTTVKSRISEGKGKFCSKKCFDENKTIPLLQRFWSKVQKTETCWIWTTGKDKDGYGLFEPKIQNARRAHRYSYFIHFGKIPKNMNVCHKCDNPSCVNPLHLFIGTAQDNVKDRQSKNRQALGIKNGAYTHPEKVNKGSSVGTSKLTEADVKNIREMIKDTEQQKIAALFNVKRHTIQRITSFQTWKHVI